MSFGFSPADIIAAVTLIAQIYEKCFTKAERAGQLAGGNIKARRINTLTLHSDQKYLQFGEEIKHFGESLDRLNNVFKHIEQQRALLDR